MTRRACRSVGAGRSTDAVCPSPHGGVVSKAPSPSALSVPSCAAGHRCPVPDGHLDPNGRRGHEAPHRSSSAWPPPWPWPAEASRSRPRGGAPNTAAEQAQEDQFTADHRADATVSEQDAIEAALARHPGKATDVHLEDEDGDARVGGQARRRVRGLGGPGRRGDWRGRQRPAGRVAAAAPSAVRPVGRRRRERAPASGGEGRRAGAGRRR